MPKITLPSRFADRRLFDLYGLLAIALAVAGLYAQTLTVPWYLDDLPVIVQNPGIRDLGSAIGEILAPRGVANFSFALNYHFGGLGLPGYHLVNIFIHFLAAWVVFLLLKRVSPGRILLPLGGALIFAAHPIQTQAVTYVVQRMASLSALLFLLALYLFVLAREHLAVDPRFRRPAHLALYAGALLAAILAILTKENTAILPFALLLFARFFLPGENGWRPLCLYLVPFLLVCAGVAFGVTADLLLPIFGGESLTAAIRTAQIASSQNNSPLNYFATELSVFWIYLRLLFLPWGQALDHSYPITNTLFNLKNIVALTGLAGLGGTAFLLRHRRPLFSCGIAWFFLTLAIESSFIPLDPLFEHRLYLPLFGFILILTDVATHLPRPQWGIFFLGCLFLVYAPLTWMRNQLWNDPIALYQDNLKVAPQSERVMSDLAKYQMDKGLFREAETLLNRALQINPRSVNAHINLMTTYGMEGRLGDAYRVINRGMEIAPDSEYFQYGLGLISSQRGELAQAIAYTQRALQLNPDFAIAYTSLGRILSRQQRFPEAEAAFRHSLTIFPEDPEVFSELAALLAQQRRTIEALEAYRQALALDPEYLPALFRGGILFAETGNRPMAQSLLKRLRTLDPGKADYLAAKLGQGRP